MMLKKRTSRRKDGNDVNSVRLAIIILLLIIGATAGSYYACMSASKEEWIINYLSQSGTAAFRSMMLEALPIIAVIYVSGFAKIGLFTTALSVAAKGFAVSAPVTACIRLFGIKGYIVSAGNSLVFALCSTLAVILASMASSGKSGSEGAKTEDMGDYTTVLMICLALCVFGGAVNAFLIK